MWQEIAIICIAIAVVIYLGYKTYRIFIRPKDNNPCKGCCGCSLKNQVQKNRVKRIPDRTEDSCLEITVRYCDK